MQKENESSIKIKSKYKTLDFNSNKEQIGNVDPTLIPFCWSLKLKHHFKLKPKPFTMPRLRQTIGLIGATFRLRNLLKECRVKKVQSFIEFFSPLQCKQYYGVPLGGIGTGTIGRSFTGDFTRFQLVPGIYEHETCEANLFTVSIKKKSSTVYQQALTTRSSKLKGFKSWNMSYCGDHAIYHALYPESWTVYNLPGQNVTLTCHQISPVIPNNYKDTSLPAGVFNWTIENNNEEDIELSLMFTWQAGSSSNKFELTDVSSKSFEYLNYNTMLSGVIINQKLKSMPLEYCIAAKKTENNNITYNCQFYSDDEDSGTQLWMDLLNDGNLNNVNFNEKLDSKQKSSKLTIALCVKVKVKAFSNETIDFSLVWNMPDIFFSGDSKTTFKRYYTKYFPSEDPNCVLDISAYSLANYQKWIEEIKNWRTPILDNKKIPDFFKCCLFNELYFLTDGGTIWLNIDNEDKSTNKIIKDYGRFAYLEGHEYRMYNTYDVHFYANFALLQLWPKLQLSLQYDFAETILKEIKIPTKYLFKGDLGLQKAKNSIPHDLGDPENKPWENLNAYVFHDTKDWKDLNLKFILTVYRDYSYLKDMEYLKFMWPYIKLLMVTVQSQDHDNDGLIDSVGLPDQTYDAWSVTGASAYCGGLHVAALKCVCEISKLLDDKETFDKYDSILKRAKEAYEKKLWNGRYYKYDCSNSDYNDSIMTDMCCGHWYLRCSGLNYEVFEKEKIKSCLETIYQFNVIKYADGKRGAVNGMRPNGSIDITSIQSEEMWIGVTDALASLMIFEDMNDEAWKTLKGMYDLMYNQLGLAFQTPESLMKKNIFRSLGYMRPLCIWSVYYAINRTHENH